MVSRNGGEAPIWSPYSTQLIINIASGYKIVDLDGKNEQPLSVNGMILEWMP